MRTIYKYPLEITDAQTIKMPEGAKILSVHNQGGTTCLWAEVDTDKELTERAIEIFGTGNPMWVDMGVQREFIGTVLDRQFVRHVYESTL
jgi:hypothetical protein